MDAFSRLRGAAETRPSSAHGLAPTYRRLAVLAGIALGAGLVLPGYAASAQTAGARATSSARATAARWNSRGRSATAP